jgi:hypothetical protein
MRGFRTLKNRPEVGSLLQPGQNVTDDIVRVPLAAYAVCPDNLRRIILHYACDWTVCPSKVCCRGYGRLAPVLLSCACYCSTLETSCFALTDLLRRRRCQC